MALECQCCVSHGTHNARVLYRTLTGLLASRYAFCSGSISQGDVLHVSDVASQYASTSTMLQLVGGTLADVNTTV